ncbi:MAG: glycosyltransferase family 4 protein, partial [Tepidiformaceae bacterium]
NAVARRVERMRPSAFVGITAHCTESMEAARRVGATTFLNVNNHAWDAMEGFEREIALARTDLEAADIQAEVAPPARYAAKNRELELADVVIAESRRIQSAVIERGVDPENVFYLPQAVDLEAFTPSERPGGARKLNVIYVGSIGYRKGLRWIGEAVERAPDAVNRFTVVGYVLVSARELQRRLAPVATFTGEVPHSEVVRHYQQADVFVLTSFAEGMVRVVLEAMASGLPVIVTPNTGYEGVITDGVEGFFVPTFDADAIAEKLTLLANDADLRLRMGRAARALAEQYPWSRFEATFLRELTARVPRLA